MSNIPSWIQDIEKENRGLPVLLVEGEDDVLLFTHFLNEYRTGWDLKLHVAAAGNKQRVITGVTRHHPEWVGIMDRDEWDEVSLQNAISRSPRLNVLPRFCIESYFCHPEELWAVLPPIQRARVSDDMQRLAEPIWKALPDWVAHGAMWRVLHRLHESAHLPTELESKPVTDEVEIRRILQTWHAQLAPDVVIEQYHQALKAARQLSPDDQLKNYVHGKKFYEQVVVQILDPLFAGKGTDDWLQKFRDAHIQPPPDLKVLLDWVVSLVS